MFRTHNLRADNLGGTDRVFTTWAVAADERTNVMGVAEKMAAMPAKAFEEHVRGKLLMYEREVKELNILLFPEVLERVARFNRVLSQPGGHLLLAGRSGVGRRTTASLVAYMHDMDFFSPKMTLSYDERAFRGDLKRILTEVGVENKETLLYIEDHQLVTLHSGDNNSPLWWRGARLVHQPRARSSVWPAQGQMMAEGTMMAPLTFSLPASNLDCTLLSVWTPLTRTGRVHRVEPCALHAMLYALDGWLE